MILLIVCLLFVNCLYESQQVDCKDIISANDVNKLLRLFAEIIDDVEIAYNLFTRCLMLFALFTK